MKAFCFLLIAVVAVQVAVASPAAPSRSYISSRIVGGRDAVENEFPYAVSVSWIWNGETVSSHQCGGSILNERWIITAAHCMFWVGGHYIIRAGALHLNQEMSGEQVSPVRRIINHPDFNEDAVVSPNDISLLELEIPLTFSPSVQPIPLPAADLVPQLTSGRVSGWGSISNNQTVIMPNTLQNILLPIISNQECEEAIAWSNTPIYEQEICTSNGSGGIGTCGGDSGSGLVQNDVLIGVVAWGFSPCSWSPSIYGRVTFFLPWINSIINGV